MQSGEDSIPILTASGTISSNTASICSSIIFGLISWMSITRAVFSATTETITLMPNTPCAAMVFRSACTPAPPEQSEPAMVSTFFI